MDYIYEKWEEKLSAFQDNVESELKEIRRIKAEMQQMQADMVSDMMKGRYVRDHDCLVLSAPKIIIGNVDCNGTQFEGGSEVIIRGSQVGIQGTGEGGEVEVRAASIRQIAEDPGVDGLEHVVGTLSQIVSQARNIIIQSNDVDSDDDSCKGTFSATPASTGTSGVCIHADKQIDIQAAATAESRQEDLEDQISALEKKQSALQSEAKGCKESFDDLASELKDLLDEKEDQMDEDKSLAPFQEFRFLSIPFAVDADADYQLLIGKSGTEEDRVTDAMTVWRKIAEYDDSHRPSKWVLMPLEEYNRYYLPLNEKYSLLSFNNEILAVSNKGTRVTRDGGITWKMAKRYELPYDDLEEIVATTDDEDYIWIKELESGSVWRGTYVKE